MSYAPCNWNWDSITRCLYCSIAKLRAIKLRWVNKATDSGANSIAYLCALWAAIYTTDNNTDRTVLSSITIPTETLDRIYLEWSQFTHARNRRELDAIATFQVMYLHLRECEDRELLDRVCDRLTELMGDPEFNRWLDQLT